jgi:hypothetical protein
MNAPTSPLRPTSARAPCFANSCLQASDRRRPSARYLPISIFHQASSRAVRDRPPRPSDGFFRAGRVICIGQHSTKASIRRSFAKIPRPSCCNLSDCRPTEARMVNVTMRLKWMALGFRYPGSDSEYFSTGWRGPRLCAAAGWCNQRKSLLCRSAARDVICRQPNWRRPSWRRPSQSLQRCNGGRESAWTPTVRYGRYLLAGPR